MTATLVQGQVVQGKLRSKQAALERALEGHVRPHHRFMLAQQLLHIDFLDSQIADFDAHIVAHLAAESPPSDPPAATVRIVDEQASPAPPSVDSSPGSSVPWTEAVELLASAPGIGRTLAEQIIAEVGTNMERFPSAAHLAAVYRRLAV